LRLLNADPPADLRDGRVLVPPNRDFVLVEFELEGEADEKVRVEVFHPDAVEDVTPKTVEGFFDVARKRVSGAERSGKSSQTLQAVKVEVAAVATPQQGAATVTSAPAQKEVASPEKEWATLVEDAGFQKALTIIETQRMINEADLQMVLGSPRRVRAFSRHFDKLRSLVPFAIEITVVSGMKAYVRKD
jgi:hypothetical protein